MDFEYYFNPDTTVIRIKKDIQEYLRTGEYSWLYRTEDEFISRFVGKTDEWLREFVMDRKNFEFVYRINGHGEYYDESSSYSAFKDMIAVERHISTLFRWGLLEGTRFGDYWNCLMAEEETEDEVGSIKYLKKAAAEDGQMKGLSGKMLEIFTRHDRTKHVYWNKGSG